MEISRPTWFLGNEEDSHQPPRPQKKWSVHEGVKMMVTSPFLSGQADFQKIASIAKALPEKIPEGSTPEKGILERTITEKPAWQKASQERNITVQVAFNGETATSKPFSMATAFATCASIPQLPK
nr:uncharacterized protein LOC117218314 [Megalopta genalis]